MIFGAYFSAQWLKFFNREIYSIVLDVLTHDSSLNWSFFFSINVSYNIIELETIVFNEVLPEELDCPIVLDLLFQYFGEVSLSTVSYELICCLHISANSWALHSIESLRFSVAYKIKKPNIFKLKATANEWGMVDCCLLSKWDTEPLFRWQLSYGHWES